MEIAMRVVFENFTYNFGGKTYLQRSGGPIGNRLTMACSRVMMQEWGETYLEILVDIHPRFSCMEKWVPFQSPLLFPK